MDPTLQLEYSGNLFNCHARLLNNFQILHSLWQVALCGPRVNQHPAAYYAQMDDVYAGNSFFIVFLDHMVSCVPSTNYPHVSTSNRQVPFLITSTYTKIVTPYILFLCTYDAYPITYN